MTTICWNKNELVADSRVSYFDEAGKKLSHTDNEVCKIYAPTSFYVDGDVVKAIAISGTDRLISILSKLNDNNVVPDTDIVVVKDFQDPAFYVQFAALIKMKSFLIIVGTASNYLLEMVPRNGGGIIWTLQKVQKDDYILAGTGAEEILAAMKDEKKLGGEVTLDDFKKTSARKIVQLGIVCDPYSGGNLRVWCEEHGHRVVEVDPPVHVAKQFADEQPDSRLPVGGDFDAELDRRLDAFLAEKRAA